MDLVLCKSLKFEGAILQGLQQNLTFICVRHGKQEKLLEIIKNNYKSNSPVTSRMFYFVLEQKKM